MNPLGYADRSTDTGPRRWSRLAIVSAVPVVLTPVIGATLLFLVNRRVLPHHFLCCDHPEVTIGSMIVLPGLGAIAGVASMSRLAMSRRRLKGWLPCVAAIVLNPVLALLGWGLYAGLRI